MEVDKTLLVKLRKETLAPFSACSEALSTSNNNYEEAKKILFKKSILKAKNDVLQSDSELPEGKLFSRSNDKYSFGVLFSLRAQTDFVTNSQNFKNLQNEIWEIISNNLDSLSGMQGLIPLEKVLSLKSPSDNLTIEEKICNISSITKEIVKLQEVWFSPQGENLVTLSYLHHNSKLGALLTFKVDQSSNLDSEEVRKLILHYSATDSLFLTEKDISENWLLEEKSKLKNSLLSKNPNIPNIDKIIEKQIKKIVSEVTFSQQEFVLDSSIKISSILSKYNLIPVWGKRISL